MRELTLAAAGWQRPGETEEESEMRRNSKISIVSVVAFVVMAAAMASSASASKFMSEGNVNVTVKGDQIGSNVLTVDGSSGTCTTMHLESAGLVASPATTVKVHPTLEGCTFFGFLNSPVTTTGCNYILGSGTESASDQFPGSMELTCETGKNILIVAGTCEVTISGPQTFGAGLVVHNSTAASPKDVILAFSSLNIAVNKIKDGFLCPLSGEGKVNATYTGEVTVKGFNSGGTQVGVTVEP